MRSPRPSVAEYPPGARLARRVLDDFELVWMLRGRATLTTDDGEVVIDPRRLLLIVPGVEHEFTWDPVRSSVHAYVHFGPEHFAGPPPAGIVVRTATGSDPIGGLCSYVTWLGRRGHDVSSAPVAATLRFLLSLLVGGPLPGDGQDAELHTLLSPAIDHLRREWSGLPLRSIGVAELARVAAVSPGHLRRLFQSEFGHNPGRALEGLRCARAEGLLAGTDLSAEVIARQCGFADVSHFSHRFVKVYAMPPSRYRASGPDAPSVLDTAGLQRLAALIWDQRS